MSLESVGGKTKALEVDVVSSFVVLSDDVCLHPDQHEFFVRGSIVSSSPDSLQGKSFVFNPDIKTMNNKDIIMAHAIVEVNEDVVPVKMIKPESQKIYLRKGTKLGNLENLNFGNGYFEDVRVLGNAIEETKDSYLNQINVGILPSNEKNKLLAVLTEYSDVFSKDAMDIGCTPFIQHN